MWVMKNPFITVCHLNIFFSIELHNVDNVIKTKVIILLFNRPMINDLDCGN